jgi:hypothetical protein
MTDEIIKAPINQGAGGDSQRHKTGIALWGS